MILKPIMFPSQFKIDFIGSFHNNIFPHSTCYDFIREIKAKDDTFVIGGFLRDIALKRKSKDLDIITAISANELYYLIKKYPLKYKLNHMGGVKILLENFEVDIWSLSNHWGYMNNLISKNPRYLLNNLALTSFYNFDSLIISLNHPYNIVVEHFNKSLTTNRLDILKKDKRYMLLNPTTLTNILKAIHIKKIYKLNFSEDCINYFIFSLHNLQCRTGKRASTLLKEKRHLYTKYSKDLKPNDIDVFLNDLNTLNDTLFELK